MLGSNTDGGCLLVRLHVKKISARRHMALWNKPSSMMCLLLICLEYLFFHFQ